MNPRQCMSGFGPNSELRMPAYRPPRDITFDPSIQHGTVDTLTLRSRLLARSHPVYVYLPPSYPSTRKKLPLVVVTDGGEYLSLGLMNNVLDNLIAARRIQPVIAVFLDPRTDPADRRTNTRMQDYALRDTFAQSLARELLPMIRKEYRVSGDAKTTAIMGASLGGLIAAYAGWSRPDAFGLCAAQSPAFSWNSSQIINNFAHSARKPLRLYIDTGTLHDAQVEARQMRDVLVTKNYRFHYAEYPEGHSWGSWRARIADILLYFYGMK
jgi:enterochelin esterase family protein